METTIDIDISNQLTILLKNFIDLYIKQDNTNFIDIVNVLNDKLSDIKYIDLYFYIFEGSRQRLHYVHLITNIDIMIQLLDKYNLKIVLSNVEFIDILRKLTFDKIYKLYNYIYNYYKLTLMELDKLFKDLIKIYSYAIVDGNQLNNILIIHYKKREEALSYTLL